MAAVDVAAPTAAPTGQGSGSGPAAAPGTLAALYGVGARLREYGASTFAQVRTRGGVAGPIGGRTARAKRCARAKRSCRRRCCAAAAATRGATARSCRRPPAPHAAPLPPPSQRKPWGEVLDRTAFAKPANFAEVRSGGARAGASA
jgi:hypothetical protein